MKNKTTFKLAASAILVASLITSPVSFNLKDRISYAEDNAYTEPVDILTVISSSPSLDDDINKIKNKRDESLDNFKEKVKKNALKINTVQLSEANGGNNKLLDESTDLAIDVKDLKKDSKLQDYLSKAIQKGKRIYLYGGLTAQEYKAFMKLEEMKVKSSTGEGSLEFGEELTSNTEKGELKAPTPEAGSVEKTSIIGYTLDEEENDQYIEINVTNHDNYGNQIENSQEIILQEILNQQAQVIEKNVETEDTEETALIKTNKVFASNQLKLDRYGYVGSAYAGGVLHGRVDTDYYLYKESSDGSSTYDHFTLKPVTQITEYNGAQSRKLIEMIDIPYDSDHLKSWTPEGDSTKVSYSLSLSYPYSISFTMNWDDAVSINDTSSLGYDYARWVITDGDLHGQVFRGAAGWASSGTRAVSDISTEGTFYYGPSDQYPIKASKSIRVSYDY